MKNNNCGVGISGGGLENRKQGYFDEQLLRLLPSTIRVFSQFNTVLDSLLQTFPPFLTGRRECKEKNATSFVKFSKSINAGGWKNSKTKNRGEGVIIRYGEYMHKNLSNIQN